MASFCPNCKGLMRPRNGVLECIRCSDRGNARTILSKGKRIALGKGQVALEGRARESAEGFDPALTPKRPDWKPDDHAGSPHPQLGLFPHEAMRDGQRRFARDATLAVTHGKHLVAHAPTGIGKTAASLAPALQAALDQDKVVMFLTSRQSQHRIAVDTLRQVRTKRGTRFGLVDLVSKRDMCLRPEVNEMHPARFPDFCAAETRTRNCKYLGEVDRDTLRQVQEGVLHVDELMAVAKDAMLCPHLVAMEAAKHAKVVVADYNHLFSDIRDASLDRLGVELSDVIVIVDEAHNLPERIKQSHAHRITDFLLDAVRKEARDHRFRELQSDCDALRECLIELADRAEKGGKAEKARLGDDDARVARLEIDDLHEAFEHSRSAGTLTGHHRTLQDVQDDLGKLAAKVRKAQDDQVFSEELRETLEDWGRFRSGALRYVEWDEMGGISLHVRLLDPSIPARKVFDAVHGAILMSGTLRPPQMISDLLGLEAGRTTVREYPNPFPPQNKVLTVARGITTRYRDRGPAMWQRIGATVSDVAKTTTGNIAVYAPSYAVLQEVRHAVDTQKEHVVEEPGLSKAERDRVLDTLRGAKARGGGVLFGVLGGSFAEGVDFRDNLLSAVIVVGLPLAPPDLEVQATIGYLDQRFPGKGRLYGYVYPAMNKVLQALGRGIRSETDKCAFLLLDQRYLDKPYRDLLPGDVELLASTDPAFTVASFLSAHGI